MMTDKNLKRIALKPSEVTQIFGIPTGTLANMRWAKKGPRYFKKPGNGRGSFICWPTWKLGLQASPCRPSIAWKRKIETGSLGGYKRKSPKWAIRVRYDLLHITEN